MRSLLCCFILLARPMAALAAQTPAPGSGWGIRVALTRDAFTGASVDTTTLPGTRVEVVPTPRLSVEVALGRRMGGWEVALSGGYAGGGLRASTAELFVDERTGGVDRYRAALTVYRDLARLEAARLSLAAGTVVDHWRVSSIGDRTTVGLRGGLVLGVALSRRLALENTALVAVGGGPFRKEDLPPGASVSALWTWSFGMGLRLRP